MITIEALKEYGANTEEGLSRCFNKKEFYLKLVSMGLADANFDKLQRAVATCDAKAAFEAAHALKGVTGNLSLTPLYAPISEMTELLRGKSEMGNMSTLLDQIMDQLEKNPRSECLT